MLSISTSQTPTVCIIIVSVYTKQRIPQGDWFCPDCRPKDIVRTPRKQRRKSIFDEEEEVDDPVTVSSESEEDSSDEDDR